MWPSGTSTVFSRCIHTAAASELHSFSWPHTIPLCGWTSLFLPSSGDAHLGCFQVWAAVSNIAMNIRVHIFVWTHFCQRNPWCEWWWSFGEFKEILF